MKIKKFDVVELKNNNKTTILEIDKGKRYYVEIVNAYGVTIDDKIKKIIVKMH